MSCIIFSKPPAFDIIRTSDVGMVSDIEHAIGLLNLFYYGTFLKYASLI
jgi:hypothetical protein